MKRQLIFSFAFVFVAMWILPAIVLAADPPNGFVPLADITNSRKIGQLYATTGDFSNFINGLFKFALVVGGMGAVLRLAYAGYLYMGQSDMWSHKGEAKKVIGDVVVGLLLLLGLWLILFQINPDILKLDALRTVKKVQQTQSPGTAQVLQGPGPFDAATCPSGQVLDPVMGATCIPR